MRSTYTYALLEVSRAAHEEIRSKLEAAGYHHAFDQDKDVGLIIDMHGIALCASKESHVEDKNEQAGADAPETPAPATPSEAPAPSEQPTPAADNPEAPASEPSAE